MFGVMVTVNITQNLNPNPKKQANRLQINNVQAATSVNTAHRAILARRPAISCSVMGTSQGSTILIAGHNEGEAFVCWSHESH